MERCRLIEKAKELAETKGLDTTEICCPVESICVGPACMIIEGKVKSGEQTTKFMKKLVRSQSLSNGNLHTNSVA